MKVPNAERAVVDIAKLRDYSLQSRSQRRQAQGARIWRRAWVSKR